MFRLSDFLLSSKKAEQHPLVMMVIGFLYASLSLFLSLWIFPEYASLVMVFFTVISCVYVVQGALILEETEETEANSENKILRGHAKTVMFMLFLFLGFLFAFAFWEVVLPQHLASHVFSIQESVVQGIRSITGDAISGGSFTKILSNNTRVLLLSIVFAVFYGAGAIFILAWNASTMGFVIGSIIKNQLGLGALPIVITKYFIHGIPEMVSYFIAALAGGIIFVTIVRGNLNQIKVKRVLGDVLLTIFLAFVLLVIAALLETYISPLF